MNKTIENKKRSKKGNKRKKKTKIIHKNKLKPIVEISNAAFIIAAYGISSPKVTYSVLYL